MGIIAWFLLLLVGTLVCAMLYAGIYLTLKKSPYSLITHENHPDRFGPS